MAWMGSRRKCLLSAPPLVDSRCDCGEPCAIDTTLNIKPLPLPCFPAVQSHLHSMSRASAPSQPRPLINAALRSGLRRITGAAPARINIQDARPDGVGGCVRKSCLICLKYTRKRGHAGRVANG